MDLFCWFYCVLLHGITCLIQLAPVLVLGNQPQTAGEVSILEPQPEGGGFRLKEGVKFHLYISTAPCGDCRIFSPHDAKSSKEGGEDEQPKADTDCGSPMDTSVDTSTVAPGQNGAGISGWMSGCLTVCCGVFLSVV